MLYPLLHPDTARAHYLKMRDIDRRRPMWEAQAESDFAHTLRTPFFDGEKRAILPRIAQLWPAKRFLERTMRVNHLTLFCGTEKTGKTFALQGMWDFCANETAICRRFGVRSGSDFLTDLVLLFETIEQHWSWQKHKHAAYFRSTLAAVNARDADDCDKEKEACHASLFEKPNAKRYLASDDVWRDAAELFVAAARCARANETKIALFIDDAHELDRRALRLLYDAMRRCKKDRLPFFVYLAGRPDVLYTLNDVAPRYGQSVSVYAIKNFDKKEFCWSLQTFLRGNGVSVATGLIAEFYKQGTGIPEYAENLAIAMKPGTFFYSERLHYQSLLQRIRAWRAPLFMDYRRRMSPTEDFILRMLVKEPESVKRYPAWADLLVERGFLVREGEDYAVVDENFLQYCKNIFSGWDDFAYYWAYNKDR